MLVCWLLHHLSSVFTHAHHAFHHHWVHLLSLGSIGAIHWHGWRVFLGVERKRPGGAAHRIEAGYVFGRELKFDSATPDATFGDTFLIRAGVDF
jgi:hypothetical protein